jgi:hypothetical protein
MDAEEQQAALQISCEKIVPVNKGSLLSYIRIRLHFEKDTYHVGSSQIIQQLWNLKCSAGGNADVQYSLGSIICFFESEVADIGANTLLENFYIHQMS